MIVQQTPEIFIMNRSHKKLCLEWNEFWIPKNFISFNETFFRLSDIIEQVTDTAEIWYGMRQLSNEIILNEFILRYESEQGVERETMDFLF